MTFGKHISIDYVLITFHQQFVKKKLCHLLTGTSDLYTNHVSPSLYLRLLPPKPFYNEILQFLHAIL